jgi:TRAP-type uncharacterized transport system fused permease subunit
VTGRTSDEEIAHFAGEWGEGASSTRVANDHRRLSRHHLRHHGHRRARGLCADVLRHRADAVDGIFNSSILSQQMIQGANTFTLLAIPFFLLAGELMNAGGLSRRIVDFAIACVGHIRGGLGLVAIVAAVIMASLSGSAAADSAALAAILIPMMREAGYNVPRAAGSWPPAASSRP